MHVTKPLHFKVTAALLALTLIFCFSSCKKSEAETTSKTTTKKTVTTTKNNDIIDPLTGLQDLDPAASGKRPIAVVVQNSEAARPQWGMCSPDIILEGLAEGGYTRMLWFYSDVNSIPKVGSIRSARIDFLEMAEGFDAIFVHCGGAQTAYAAIKARGIDTIDGADYLGKYMFRDQQRLKKVSMEHTVYTTGDLLSQCISDHNYDTKLKDGYSNILSFNKEGAPEKYSAGTCTELRIMYSYNFTYTFKYNADTKTYYNFIGHDTLTKFTQDGGQQVNFTNVVILYFPSYKIINYKGSVDMDLSGGTGLLISNGTYENITWEKGNTPSNTLKLKDHNGDTLRLNAGKSYIGLVPKSNASSTVITQ